MRRVLALLLMLSPLLGFADDKLAEELLSRVQQGGESKFHYQETRQLELAATPWRGEGYLLSGADGSLVKLQLKPKRVVMAIAHRRMYYWDPELKQRHSAPLDAGGPGAQPIALFRAILQGKADELRRIYDFAAEKQGKTWSLRMTSKAGQGGDAPSVEMSGDQDGGNRRILIGQPDGESSEYKMSKAEDDQAPKTSLPDLLREAIGD